MTDDEFVFDDEATDRPDENDLFGASADDPTTESTFEPRSRFGRPPTDEDASIARRLRSAVSGLSARTAAVALVVTFVVVVIVGYPVVMDALDSPNRGAGGVTTTPSGPSSALPRPRTEPATTSTRTPTAIPERPFLAGEPPARNTTKP